MTHSAILCFLIVLALLFFKPIKQRINIALWSRSLDLARHQRVFQQLYQPIDGFRLSKQARSTVDALDYTYGEIDFVSFIALMSLILWDETSVFYDLGSGTGKAVLAVAMVFPVQKSIGVELLAPLHLAACQQQKQLSLLPEYAACASRIKFIQADFLQLDLENANIIFINASTIIGPTWTTLCQRLDELTNLQRVITTSKALSSKKFAIIRTTKVLMSWGVVRAFIHEPVL